MNINNKHKYIKLRKQLKHTTIYLFINYLIKNKTIFTIFEKT